MSWVNDCLGYVIWMCAMYGVLASRARWRLLVVFLLFGPIISMYCGATHQSLINSQARFEFGSQSAHLPLYFFGVDAR